MWSHSKILNRAKLFCRLLFDSSSVFIVIFDLLGTETASFTFYTTVKFRIVSRIGHVQWAYCLKGMNIHDECDGGAGSSSPLSSPRHPASWYYLDITEDTTELPVSDLSPWSNQIRMTVMLSQQFLPNLENHFITMNVEWRHNKLTFLQSSCNKCPIILRKWCWARAYPCKEMI